MKTAEGVDMIYAEEELLNVLKLPLKLIDENNHIRPIIYTDKELEY